MTPLPRRREPRIARRTGVIWIAAVVILAEVIVGSGIVDRTASAWDAGCRRKTPTRAQRKFNGVDLKASTHQWFATRAIEILGNDGSVAVPSFLATPDPTAPAAIDPASGTPTGQPESYGWRLIKGADDADCLLYKQVPDHLHNFWSHRGRRMIVGQSAASYAELAFANATTAWRAGDRSMAMEWLGASLHLVQDSCVPQHNFYGVGINHSSYERWVLDNQDALAVSDKAILAADFRPERGHGGANWSSSNPRGWADECAHRAAGILRTASANVPKVAAPTDPQWRTAPHLAETQRLGAGFVQHFFTTVGAA